MSDLVDSANPFSWERKHDGPGSDLGRTEERRRRNDDNPPREGTGNQQGSYSLNHTKTVKKTQNKKRKGRREGLGTEIDWGSTRGPVFGAVEKTSEKAGPRRKLRKT